MHHRFQIQIVDWMSPNIDKSDGKCICKSLKFQFDDLVRVKICIYQFANDSTMVSQKIAEYKLWRQFHTTPIVNDVKVHVI